ncbi:MAG: DUF6134 family protein [Pseudomonadota bacterium]
MHRRHLVTGLPAAALFAAGTGFPAAADGGAFRAFRVMRAGRDIGRHTLSATGGPDGFALDIEIDLVVRILGIAAYRYEMRVSERWAGGRLVAFESTTNDDGTDDFARMRREGEGIAVDGSAFSGLQPGDAAVTTYHSLALMERRPWLSSQTGTPVSIDPRPVTGESGAFEMRGDLGSVLIYDGSGDWIGCRFDAGGEPAEYELIDTDGSIAAAWAASA